MKIALEITSILMFLFFVSLSCQRVIRDIDDNFYSTVKIGQLEWMAEDLKTTRYSDGSIIINLISDFDWEMASEGAYAWYDNDIKNKSLHGALYNWYAVNDNRGLCPVGWRVATDRDWKTLIEFADGEDTAGGRLKATGTLEERSGLWRYPNTDAVDEFGFSAIPNGGRLTDGSFGSLGFFAGWWGTSQIGDDFAWTWGISYNSGAVRGIYDDKRNGYSVRCVRDI